MGKIITLPPELSPTGFKNLIDIPANPNNIIIDGQNLDISGIKISDVKAVLGHSNYKLSELCTHENINMWARFRPGGVNIINDQFVYVPKTSEFKLGDFAGYNHEAKEPKILGTGGTINFTQLNQTINIPILIELGEIDWINEVGVYNVKAELYRGANLLDIVQEDIKNGGIAINFEHKTTQTTDYTLTVKVNIAGVEIGTQNIQLHRLTPAYLAVYVWQPSPGLPAGFYVPETQNEQLHGSNFTFEVKIRRYIPMDQGGGDVYYNDYWDIYDGVTGEMIIEDKYINSSAPGWNIIQDSVSWPPSPGDVVKIYFVKHGDSFTPPS